MVVSEITGNELKDAMFRCLSSANKSVESFNCIPKVASWLRKEPPFSGIVMGIFYRCSRSNRISLFLHSNQ